MNRRERPAGPDPTLLLALAAIVAVGALARVLLVQDPLRYDESYSFVMYAMRGAGFITTHYNYPNNHILSTLAEHSAWRLFGAHVWVVRLSALVAGIAILPATYLAGRALYGSAAGLWAMALVAGADPLVDYSDNGRGYTLGILLALVALWLAASLLDGARRWRWAPFALCCALAFYAVPTLAYAIGAIATWTVAVALVRRDFRALLGLAVALGAAALLALALYSGVLGQMGWTASRPLEHSLAATGELVSTAWRWWNDALPGPLEWLVIAGFAASLVLHRRLARHPVPIALAALAVVVGALLFTPAARVERAWLWLLPLYLIHAGAGLSYAAERVSAWVPRPALAATASAAALAVALAVIADGNRLHTVDQPPMSDNAIVGFLSHQLRPGESAVLHPWVAVASMFYLRRDGYQPAPLPARRVPTTAVVVVPRGTGPRGVADSARSVGWHVVSGARLTLVRRFEYVEAWRARLD